MKFIFECPLCDCQELTVDHLDVQPENTKLFFECMDCNTPASVSITDTEARALGATKVPKKPNGGS